MLEAPKAPCYGRSLHNGATKCKALRNARRSEMQGAPKCKNPSSSIPTLEAPKAPCYGRSPQNGAMNYKALRNARRYEMQGPPKCKNSSRSI